MSIVGFRSWDIFTEFVDTARGEYRQPAQWSDLWFGSYPKFEWKTNVSPFSHWITPLATGIVYLFVVFSFKAYLAQRDRNVAKATGKEVKEVQKAAKENKFLKFCAMIHNLILTWLSLGMMMSIIVFSIWEGIKFYSEHPSGEHNGHGFVYHWMCDPTAALMKGPLGWVCYVFYASKYYELFDTVLLLLRRSELIFLHWFHHAVVPFLFWWLMQTDHTQQLVLVIANSFVHTPMYYYYYLAIAHPTYKPWWKKHITLCQIVQFIVDLGTSYMWVAWNGMGGVHCSGTFFGIVLGNVIGIAFLILFTRFFIKEYSAGNRKKAVSAKKLE
eukprot:ANDGO_02720.mRNA.1 Elongation of fatty acids protein A